MNPIGTGVCLPTDEEEARRWLKKWLRRGRPKEVIDAVVRSRKSWKVALEHFQPEDVYQTPSGQTRRRKGAVPSRIPTDFPDRNAQADARKEEGRGS